MQYYHGEHFCSWPQGNFLGALIVNPGISPSTGLPFSPPVAFTFVNNASHSKQTFKAKQEKLRVEQGKCHKCHRWIAVEGVKDVDVKVCLGA
jgi:hypothetical protein